MRKIYILVAVLVVIGAMAASLMGSRSKNSQPPVACTMEAKICPDGSAVGRTGPNCEFAACPSVVSSSSASLDVALGFGETGMLGDISVTPNSLTQDSRCPSDVQCIWAGALKVSVTLADASKTEIKEMTLGEAPYVFGDYRVSITSATPVPQSAKKIANDEYRLTFHLAKGDLTYTSASADVVKVSSPLPGETVGKNFSLTGEARGTYFFEASFPVIILDKNGAVLVQTHATATSDWMTEKLVPFMADISIPETYSGPAKIVLKKDNPSGLPENDASVSFDVVIQ